MDTAITVHGLVKHFGAVRAVDGVSFSVSQGKLFGFLGPNGAGKTTTLRCLMDFLRPDAGEVRILGLDSRQDSVAIKRRVGYVPSDAHLYEAWSAREHIAFVERLRGHRHSSSELIERFGVELDAPVRQLSTGNRQKLVLLLGFIGNPELVILDEPTRGLDPVYQRIVDDVLHAFCAKGGTVLLSSHDLAEVDRLCSRVAIIRQGKLVAVEGLDDLRQKAVHLVTVEFRQPVDTASFAQPGVELTVTGLVPSLHARVTGDLTPFLQAVSAHEVKDLEVTHASLEEVFLKFYERT